MFTMKGELFTFLGIVAVWAAATAFDRICEFESHPKSLNHWTLVEFEPVPPFLINTYSHTHDLESQIISNNNAPYEQDVWDFMVNLKPSGRAPVVHVGAGLGYFALLAASLNYSVVAFEANDENVKRFNSSISANNFEDRISLRTNVVSSRVGRVHPMHHDLQHHRSIFKDAMRLDKLVFSNVSVLRISAHGYEGDVIQSASRLLCQFHIEWIVLDNVEVSAHCNASEMQQVLKEIGYEKKDFGGDIKNSPHIFLKTSGVIFC